MKNILLFGIITILTVCPGFSQDIGIQKELVERNFYIISKVESNQVVLRWAPTEAEHWVAANTIGYYVDRLEIPTEKEGLAEAKFVRLNDSPISPWPVADWETIVETDDNAAIGYMTIYGEQPAFQGDVFTSLAQKDDFQRKAYFYAMTAAGQSAQAAEAMGLRYTDENIKAETRYIYRVYTATAIEGFKIDTAMVMVNTADITEALAPVGIETISFEKKVLIQWPTHLNREVFSSFYIEKSNRAEGPFTRLNNSPLTQLKSEDIPEFNEHYKLVDSVAHNYTPYYYRVVGLTHFGEESPASEVVMGMGKDFTPPGAPIIINAEVNEQYQVELEWEKLELESDFRGFIVGRSALAEGPFSPIHDEVLPPFVYQFTDEYPNPRGLNFYQITAIDTAGNVGYSSMKYAAFQDTFPPEPPTMLSGNIDTVGIVNLEWAANTEHDLMGYRVYFANAKDHEFIQISKELLKQPSFKDTINLNTLTEEIYYRVVAVDRGFGHSVYSEILMLKRPDIVAPSSGVFTNYHVEGNDVILEWAPSSSSDVVQQRIYRRTAENSEVIGVFNMDTRQFVDKGLINGTQYSYSLETIDDDGLVSDQSRALNIKITDVSAEESIQNFAAHYNEENKIIELQWEYNNTDPNCRFVIYRSAKGQGLISYASVSDVTHFEDSRLSSTGEYAYAIMVISTQGRSPLSEQISIVVE